MQVAHILVKYKDKKSVISWDDLKFMQEIKTVDPTFGAFDAVIKIEAKSKLEIIQIITDRIRNRQMIQDTITLLDNNILGATQT